MVSFIVALLLHTHSRKLQRQRALESIYEGVKFNLPYHRSPDMTMILSCQYRGVNSRACQLLHPEAPNRYSTDPRLGARARCR